LALKRSQQETLQSNILQNKRLLQRRGKACISREAQALACVTGDFSPSSSGFARRN